MTPIETPHRPSRVVHRVRHFVRHRILRAFEEFFSQEASGGLVLIFATAAALLWANLATANYAYFWNHESIHITGREVVNDGLMAIFFFVVGLEIKRELLVGELATVRRAALPVLAAAGGAILPALIFAAMNLHSSGSRGWGIPMATDIAFAVGIMALLGSRVPLGIKVFLTALAIADDLMAVLVIAFFYTAQIKLLLLAVAGVLLLALLALNRAGVCRAWPYLLCGVALWYATLLSGVHSTVAGVAVAACIPAQGEKPLLRRLEHRLHPFITFGIMPVFALANAGLALHQTRLTVLANPVVTGVSIGLLIGKPLGITLASLAAVRLRLADLPSNVGWLDLHAASWLGGIGFTMSLFIGDLAFRSNGALLELAKLGIFAGSLTAAILGSLLLFLRTDKAVQPFETA